jgi:hypothetical protein
MTVVQCRCGVVTGGAVIHSKRCAFYVPPDERGLVDSRAPAMTLAAQSDPQGAQALAARLHYEAFDLCEHGGFGPNGEPPEWSECDHRAAAILGEHGLYVPDVRELRARISDLVDIHEESQPGGCVEHRLLWRVLALLPDTGSPESGA